MNRQETYEKVRDHLLKQKARSVADDRSCMYRGNDGLKCAIGCLIPDDLYRPEMEGKSPDADELFNVRAYLDVFDGDDENFLCDLQELHDGSEPWYWPARLADFAEEHGLTP